MGNSRRTFSTSKGSGAAGGVVVDRVGVALPDLDPRAGQGPPIGRQHAPGDVGHDAAAVGQAHALPLADVPFVPPDDDIVAAALRHP